MYVKCDGLELTTTDESGWVIDRPSNFREDKRFEKKIKIEATFFGYRIDNALVISSFKSLIDSYYKGKLSKKIYKMGFYHACHLYINKESLLVISIVREWIESCLQHRAIIEDVDPKYFVCLDYYKIKRLDYFVNIIFNHVINE
ncbi:hypothetical protein ACTVJH_13735 [Desulfoplanes sp. PS50]